MKSVMIVFLAILFTPSGEGWSTDCARGAVANPFPATINLDVSPGAVTAIHYPAGYDTMAVMNVTDFDKDGFADIILKMGRPGASEGELRVLYGYPYSGGVIDLDDPSVRMTIFHFADVQGFWSIAQVETGDIDADGATDLIVNHHGAMYVMLGKRISIGENRISFSDENIIHLYTDLELDQYNSFASIKVVDLNGDGYDDFICSAPGVYVKGYRGVGKTYRFSGYFPNSMQASRIAR